MKDTWAVCLKELLGEEACDVTAGPCLVQHMAALPLPSM